MNTEEFIRRAMAVHGDRYGYSLEEYTGCRTKVDLVCSKHGKFKQFPYGHLSGKGCIQCVRELVIYNQSSTEDFIVKAVKIHGKRYDYSLVEYRKSRIKVKIRCPEHGDFEMTPNNHLRGNGCYDCSVALNAEKRRLSFDKFVARAVKVHGNKYSYSGYVQMSVKVKIECPEHGEFLQLPLSHVKGRGCPWCQESKGERRIALLLKDHGIVFERQKRFDDCRNIRLLSFDFFLPALNTCIEFDGKQHLEPVDFFGGKPAFEYRKKVDLVKTKFCVDHSIKLVRISMFKQIETILKKEGVL